MAQVAIDWKPKTKIMGDYHFVRATDGDTPFIELPVRMLSIDAPETHFEGRPDRHERRLNDLRRRIEAGKFAHLPARLQNHLLERLDGQAGRRQYVQGLMAEACFREIISRARRVLVLTSGEQIDRYGRLLAYLTRYLTKRQLEKTPREKRTTFNLQMVAAGWAAPMPIYPSLPRKDDFERLCEAAREAREAKRGIWEDPKTLLAYEYRMCIKMARDAPVAEYLPRYCADVTTKKLYKPEDYCQVLPEYRLFIWQDQTNAAIAELGLT